MKLWIFNHYAIAPGKSGITRDYDLSKRLIDAGHEVTIFASSFDHRTRKENYFSKESKRFYKVEKLEGIRYVWIRTTPYKKNNLKRVFNILSYAYRGLKASRRIEGKPDTVMGTIVHPLAAFLGYVVAQNQKALFYFEERDLWPETLIHLGKFSEKNPIIKVLGQLELFLYKKAKRIIVLFDKAPDYVRSKGIEERKIIYLPNGVDIERYNRIYPLPEDMEKKIEGLEEKFLAVYTGAHGLANNLDVLINTAKIIQETNNNIHFLFVGDGVEKERLISRVKNEKIHNISFFDPISKDLIPSLLSRCNVGLISMLDADLYKWGMSLNKVYDYMAASIPTIIRCNMSETIVQRSNGGVEVKSEDEMAERLEYAYRHPEIMKQMGLNAREYVEEYHSWDENAKTLIQAMNEDLQNEKHVHELKGGN
ncbi:glycosyltransferase family 4 protein [Sutcliffiella horikoshii]|uniref:glycosyltransferase family 4 protein n=1 Tax=Sutcliffiella horikoshii TaxID=79883 RepID=UPI001F22BD93|nr:glycosyltransferase family 4 protein [Sutcliffiella horikoshii]MCG1021558.1 glycosyltransferase WbuB [Sutcliffiella horikoshii]